MSGKAKSMGITEYITNFAKTFQDARKEFDKQVTKTNQELANVAQVLRKETVFDEPDEFYSAIDKVTDSTGYVALAVLQIEEARVKLQQAMANPQKPMGNGGGSTPNITVHASAPIQEGPGFFGWQRERERQKTERMRLEASQRPQITTAKKPRDVLDYCTELPAELNKLIDWFEHKALGHLHFFNGPKTRKYFHGELRPHATKLVSVVTKTFMRAIGEYRKELVGSREQKYAEAITMMEQARYLAQTGRGGSPFGVDPLGGEMRKRVGP